MLCDVRTKFKKYLNKNNIFCQSSSMLLLNDNNCWRPIDAICYCCISTKIKDLLRLSFYLLVRQLFDEHIAIHAIVPGSCISANHTRDVRVFFLLFRMRKYPTCSVWWGTSIRLTEYVISLEVSLIGNRKESILMLQYCYSRYLQW